MVVLFKKDNILYVKCLLNLKKPVVHQNKVFNPGLTTLYLLPEEINTILAANGNIKFWNGKKYIKLNLGQFNDVMKNKKLKVEIMKEEKSSEVKKPEQNKKVFVKHEPKKEEVKESEEEEERVIEIPVIVEPKDEVKMKEEDKKPEQNKKQRHKNNNQQQEQGGDK